MEFKVGHSIMIKRSTIQEKIRTLNVYAPKNRTSKYMKQKLIKLQGEVDKSTNNVRDVSILLSSMDISSGQKIFGLNSTTLLDTADIYRQLRLTTADYTFFLS